MTKADLTEIVRNAAAAMKRLHELEGSLREVFGLAPDDQDHFLGLHAYEIDGRDGIAFHAYVPRDFVFTDTHREFLRDLGVTSLEITLDSIKEKL